MNPAACKPWTPDFAPAADQTACAVAQVVGAGVAAAEKLGLKWQKMVSRAYHDSLFMARVRCASCCAILSAVQFGCNKEDC